MRRGEDNSDHIFIRALGRRARAWVWLVLLGTLSWPVPAGAGDPKIVVAPLIVAEFASELDLDVQVEPASSVTTGTLLIISGLPKSIVFSAGDAIAPGVWQVPVRALPKLKMVVPPGEPSRSNLLFLLIKEEKGAVILASSRSVMVVDGPSAAARAKQLEDAKGIEAARAEEQRRLAAAKAAEEDRLAQVEEARKAAEAKADELRQKLAAAAAEEDRLRQAKRIEEEAARAEEQHRLAAAKAAEEDRLAQIRQAEEARKAAEAKADELRQKLAAAAAKEERLRQAKRIEEEAARAEEQRRLVAAALDAEQTQLAQTKRADEVENAETARADDRRREFVNVQPANRSTGTTALPTEQTLAATRLLKRGEEQLSQGNVLAARQYFLRAAQAGLADAAFKLGETHDPTELARWNVQGVMPDLTEAKAWYKRALHLGVLEAKERLARLGE